MKKAHILGELEKNNTLAKAIQMLRTHGYKVSYTPVSGIANFEVNCMGNRISDLSTLKKFLIGEKILHSIWTIV